MMLRRLLVLVLFIASWLVPVAPAAAAGWDGTIGLAVDSATTSANSSWTMMRVTLSKPKPYGWVFTMYDDNGSQTYCAPSVSVTTFAFQVAPPGHQSRSYTGYMSLGTSCPSTRPASPDATSNTVTVTNIGYDGTISLAVDSATTSANSSWTMMRVTLSKPRPSGMVFTMYDDTGAQTYCAASVTATTFAFQVAPPVHQSRSYTGYMSLGTNCPSTRPASPDATSNTVTVTNIGYDGTLALVSDRILVDPQTPSATLTLTMTKPRPGGMMVTIFNSANSRVACLPTITATTYSTTVSPPSNQSRTYTAYISYGTTCPTLPPLDADRTAAATVYSGIDNPARTDMAGVSGIVATAMTSSEACLELSWSPTATHNAGSSLSDQQLACEAAITQGAPLKEALARAQAIFNAAGAGTTWWLLHQATTTHPVAAPPVAPPDPTEEEGENRAAPSDPTPGNPDPVWRVSAIAQALIDHNPDAALDTSTATTVASQCAWRTARAGLVPVDVCETLPIFATGSDVATATIHNAEAIDTNPAQWTLLTRGPSNKATSWRKGRCDAIPDPYLPDPLNYPSGRFHCDEYPYLSSDQGGGQVAPAPHLKKIDGGHNEIEGWTLQSFYSKCGLDPASSRPFLVIPLVSTVVGQDGYTSLDIPTLKLCNPGSVG